MLALEFGGWFECRLATDPDPSDEPRGISGWTFAVAGEPDLDRIIRCQPGRAINRKPGPRVGVRIQRVSLFGQARPQHPLIGGTFELLDGPVFEGRNGIVAASAQEPILPVHVKVEVGGIALRREHRDPMTGEFVLDPPTPGPPPRAEIRRAAGIHNATQYRAERRLALQRALAATPDPVEAVALRKRLADFERQDVSEIAVASLEYWVHYRLVLRGPWAEVVDQHESLRPTIDTESAWVAEFWAGAWDADALCGYLAGQLSMPVHA